MTDTEAYDIASARLTHDKISNMLDYGEDYLFELVDKDTNKGCYYMLALNKTTKHIDDFVEPMSILFDDRFSKNCRKVDLIELRGA